MPNIVNIQFQEDLINDSTLLLEVSISNIVPPATNHQYVWLWATIRDAPFKITTGTSTPIPGERSAINFVTAFNLDLNATGIYNVLRVGNKVTITGQSSTIGGVSFDGGAAYNPGQFLPNPNIIFTYGSVNTTNFLINSITYLSNPINICGSVSVIVNTNQITTNIISPYIGSPNSEEFSFLFSRGSAGILTIKNGQGIEITKTFQTPPFLNKSNFGVTVNNSPNGATLIVTKTNILQTAKDTLLLKYALVPPNTSPAENKYQTNNVYSGIAPGNYWMYIKDQFGCSIYLPFTVDEILNSKTPFFYLSKAMSFRFAERVNFNLSGKYKNDENTLSCEVDVQTRWKEIQQFQENDVITTQFKSNYKINTAYIVKSDESEIAVPVIERTNNIGVKDKRDAIKINLLNGKTGIYFQTGKIYDYDTGIEINTYALNGALPYWATPGNYFSFNNSWFKISDMYYDDDINADIIVVDAPYIGLPMNVIVGCIYNLSNYEVFEFTINLAAYLNQNVRVRIKAQDPLFDSITFLSEEINIKSIQEDTLEIKYSNPENTDVYYSTGIENMIRVMYTKINGKIPQNSENYKTDTITKLLSAEVYESDEFVFEPVTKEMMRKLSIALSQKNVTINGVAYVKDGDMEIEGPLEKSNLYVPKITMIKSNNAFSTENSDGVGFENIEIPGLISNGAGFIEHSS